MCILQRILIFSLVAVAFFNAIVSAKSPGTVRIINGWETTIDKVPYIVQLRDAGFKPAYCAGTLVTSKYVITAAHCFLDRVKEKVRIFAGANKRRGEGGVERGIAKLTMHPEYSNFYHSDIAILELDAEMPLGDTIAVLPLCSAPVPPQQLVTVSGWGGTEVDSKSDVLRQARIHVTTREACIKQYWILKGKNMFCAGGGPKGMDTCSGDSGGPVEYGAELCGIVGSGPTCGAGTAPGMYTDVYAERSFIRSVIPELFK